VARQQVHVVVEYGLARRLAIRLIDRQAFRFKCFLQRIRDLDRGAGDRFRLRHFELEKIRGVLLHRHQHVARIDLAKVHERERVLVFVDPRRRNLSGHDPAEHAIAHALPPAR